eukprot:2864969-Karenia_brevis.AAC.1
MARPLGGAPDPTYVYVCYKRGHVLHILFRMMDLRPVAVICVGVAQACLAVVRKTCKQSGRNISMRLALAQRTEGQFEFGLYLMCVLPCVCYICAMLFKNTGVDRRMQISIIILLELGL